jgi:hypothetical protein
MGEDMRTADWKSELAEGAARRARTKSAPLLCPATVILEGLPLKEGTTVCKKLRAVIRSPSARFVWPLGGKNPNCDEVEGWASFFLKKRGRTYGPETILNNGNNGAGCGGQFGGVEAGTRRRTNNERPSVDPV